MENIGKEERINDKSDRNRGQSEDQAEEMKEITLYLYIEFCEKTKQIALYI